MQMIRCEQGSPAWLRHRRGIATASHFASIVTPTGKATKSAARKRYMIELCGERLTGKTRETFVTAAMARGTELEPRARAWYELETGKQVEEVGFVKSDCGRWGCSPDGLVGDDRGVEIKIPGLVALLTMIDAEAVDPDYLMQVQANLWITGRDWWDFVLWTDEPGLPAVIWPQKVDPVLHAAFAEHVPAFCDELDEIEARLRELPVPLAAECEAEEAW
jgi:hypothetical protein